jgi:hypothetical protein
MTRLSTIHSWLQTLKNVESHVTLQDTNFILYRFLTDGKTFIPIGKRKDYEEFYIRGFTPGKYWRIFFR